MKNDKKMILLAVLGAILIVLSINLTVWSVDKNIKSYEAETGKPIEKSIGNFIGEMGKSIKEGYDSP